MSRVSPRFWDFSWSGTDVADALQQSTIHVEALMELGGDRLRHRIMHPETEADYDRLLSVAVGHAAEAAWTLMADERARVVMVEPEQLLSLPEVETGEDALALVKDAHPPFPITYFDVAGPSGEGIPFDPLNPSGTPFHTRLVGAIFFDLKDGLIVMPILSELKKLKHGLHILVPGRVTFPRDSRAMEAAEAVTLADMIVLADDRRVLAETYDGEQGQKASGTLHFAYHVARRLLPLMMLLESVNVDLVGKPLTPKQQSVGERKRRDRPLVVSVKRSVRRSSDPAANGSGRHLTTQHEVMGHFKHHGPGTPIFKAAKRDKPEKVVEVGNRGPVVRVWTPPHVRGPVGTTLVIKARRLTGDDARINPEEVEQA